METSGTHEFAIINCRFLLDSVIEFICAYRRYSHRVGMISIAKRESSRVGLYYVYHTKGKCKNSLAILDRCPLDTYQPKCDFQSETLMHLYFAILPSRSGLEVVAIVLR